VLPFQAAGRRNSARHRSRKRLRIACRSLIDPALAELQKKIAAERDDTTDSYMTEISDIVLGSLMVATELCCTDGFAKARLSDRTTELRTYIEEHIIGCERRSRASGGASCAA